MCLREPDHPRSSVAHTPAPTWSWRELEGPGHRPVPRNLGRLPGSGAGRRGGARRHLFTSLAPSTGAPLMRLAIKKRASGRRRGSGPPPGRAGLDGAPGRRAPSPPRARPSAELRAPGPWRKRGRCGPPRCSSCSPASRMRWAWATCGASPTCARCTAEVSAGARAAPSPQDPRRRLPCGVAWG